MAKLLSEEKNEEKTCLLVSNINNPNTPQHKLRGEKTILLKNFLIIMEINYTLL